MSVTVSDGLHYTNSGTVSGPGYSIGSDGFGVTNIGGLGTLPGTAGGTASVLVDVNRFLFWTFGSIAVNDPAAGINNISAPIFFGSVPNKVNGSSTVSASWFTFGSNGFVPYTITATFHDA